MLFRKKDLKDSAPTPIGNERLVKIENGES